MNLSWAEIHLMKCHCLSKFFFFYFFSDFKKKLNLLWAEIHLMKCYCLSKFIVSLLNFCSFLPLVNFCFQFHWSFFVSPFVSPFVWCHWPLRQLFQRCCSSSPLPLPFGFRFFFLLFNRVLRDSIGLYVGPSVRRSQFSLLFIFFSLRFLNILNIAKGYLKLKI